MSEFSVSQEWLNELGGSAITRYNEVVEEDEYENRQRVFESEGRDCDDYSWVYDCLSDGDEVGEMEMERYTYLV